MKFIRALAALTLLSLIAMMVALIPGLSVASQGPAFLDTTGVYSGLAAANRVNGALDALLTCNKGSSAPTNALGGTPKAGQCWLDDTSATLLVKKTYSGSAWIVDGVYDVTNSIWMPVVGGGSVSIASATTTDICASQATVQTVTGTTTIASFGSSCKAGAIKVVIFSTALTLSNSAALIIPGGVSVSTANGDIAIVTYLGSGNWRVLSYVKITGAAVSSIAGNTGAFTLGNGIDNSGNQIQLTAARRTLPTVSFVTTGSHSGGFSANGSGTYTPPANCLWIDIQIVGGGGGGNNSTSSTAGGNTTFSTLTAGGGGSASVTTTNGAGGTATGGNYINVVGGSGGTSSGVSNGAAGNGGNSFFGGSGGGGAGANAGQPGAGGSGSGGGGGGGGATNQIPSGGGAGGYVRHIIANPGAVSYSVGAGGAGASGTSAGNGGAGGGGQIIITEHYGS